jgi:ABC-2 type transport system ATP-binding protein
MLFGMPATESSARQSVGFLPEQPYFHKFLTPKEIISTHAALAGVPRHEIRRRTNSAIERAGIAEYADTRIAKLSKGLTQRVGIAQAIVANPQLLVLDEPTSGLDPIGRRHMRDLLIELRNEGKTVFLSSHLLSEIENLCDIVAVLKAGKLVACGAPDKIKSANLSIVVTTTGLDKTMCNRLTFLDAAVEHRNDCAIVRTSPKNLYPLMHVLEELGVEISKVETERESLEDAFLRLAA